MLSSLLIRTTTTKAQTATALLPKVISSTSTNQVHALQTRSKHSNRQVKRLFKQHPAFHRVSIRNETQPKKDVTPPPEITLEPIYQPSIVLPNGWSNPPVDEDIVRKRDEIPFGIRRTGNKPNGAVGFLPVYSNVRYVYVYLYVYVLVYIWME